MKEEKPETKNNSLAILEKIKTSLDFLADNHELFDDDYHLSGENIKKFSSLFSLQIRKFYKEDPNILLTTIEENLEVFSHIFRSFLSFKLDSASDIVDLLIFLNNTKTTDSIPTHKKTKKIQKIIEHRGGVLKFPYLASAIYDNRLDIAIKLVDLGAKVSLVFPGESNTYLHLLSRHFSLRYPIPENENTHFTAENMVSLTQKLIKRGANINAKNVYGNTALHYAALIDNKLVASSLLTIGAETYVQNKEGETSLHVALVCGNLRVAKLLLKYSFVFCTDNEDNSPLDVAKKARYLKSAKAKEYQEIIEIIKKTPPYFKKELRDVNTAPTRPEATSSKKEEKFTSR